MNRSRVWALPAVLLACSSGRGYGDDDPDWLSRSSKGLSDTAVNWCRHQVMEMDPIVRKQFSLAEVSAELWPCVVGSAMTRCLMLCYNVEHDQNCPVDFMMQIKNAEWAATPHCRQLSEIDRDIVDDASIQFRLMRFLRTGLEQETDCKTH